jgi:hypothetical protein
MSPISLKLECKTWYLWSDLLFYIYHVDDEDGSVIARKACVQNNMNSSMYFSRAGRNRKSSWPVLFFFLENRKNVDRL